MRSFHFLIVTFVLMLWTGTAISDIEWDFGDCKYQIYHQPSVSRGEGKMVPFITSILEKNPEGEATDESGIVFSPGEGDSFWVYEIYNETAGKIVKRVTLNEMLGLKKGQGCDLISNEQPDAKTIITRYKINPAGYDLNLSRITRLIADPNVPKGNKVVMVFELTNLSEPFKARFTERHQNDDYAFSEKNALYTVNKQSGHDGSPILVQVYAPELMTISADGEPKEKSFNVSAAVWKPFLLEKKKFNRPNVEVGRITFVAASFQNTTFTNDQAKNIANYLITGKSRPQLSVTVEVDKKEAYPGDILTYQLTCFNIGTGKAVDGSIMDPLPAGVEYVPGSASGEGTQITYSMDSGKTFQPQSADNVTHIKWDIVKPIEAGDFVKASFQAKVKEK